MFCPNCGSQIDEGQDFCKNCGYDFKKNNINNNNLNNNNINNGDPNCTKYNPEGRPNGNFWFNVLSFFSLIAALVIFFIFKDDDPVIAKNALKYAAIAFVVRIIVVIIYLVIYFAFIIKITNIASDCCLLCNLNSFISSFIM